MPMLPAATIGPGGVVRHGVADKRCVLTGGLYIGVDAEADRQRFHVTERGVALVTVAIIG